MKILVASQAFYRQDNGLATFMVRLTQGLADAGHAVMVLTPSEERRPFSRHANRVTIQSVPAIHFGHNVNISYGSHRIIAETMAQFEPDIVHVQDHFFLSRVTVREARRQGIPVVGTNHFLPDNWTDNLRITAWGKAWAQRMLWDHMLGLFNRLDAATVPTETAVSILQQQPIQIPVQAISCGVDNGRFYPRRSFDEVAIEEKYGLAADKIRFIYVGRVDREKGLDTALHALAQAERQDTQLIIAGKGSFLSSLKQLRDALGLGNQIVFTGYVPDADLPLLLNCADYFVMAGHAELQSIATLEGMSCGLPTLAARARALPELVHHQHNGYLFTPHDATDMAHGLNWLADNVSHWPEMSKAAIEMAQPHSLHNTVQQYVVFYEKVIGKKVGEWVIGAVAK